MSQSMPAREQRISSDTLSSFEKTNLGKSKECVQECANTIADHLKEYVRENPGTAALWCFGIGFVLGWRLKPW